MQLLLWSVGIGFVTLMCTLILLLLYAVSILVITFWIIFRRATSLPCSLPTNTSSCSIVSVAAFLCKKNTRMNHLSLFCEKSFVFARSHLRSWVRETVPSLSPWTERKSAWEVATPTIMHTLRNGHLWGANCFGWPEAAHKKHLIWDQESMADGQEGISKNQMFDKCRRSRTSRTSGLCACSAEWPDGLPSANVDLHNVVEVHLAPLLHLVSERRTEHSSSHVRWVTTLVDLSQLKTIQFSISGVKATINAKRLCIDHCAIMKVGLFPRTWSRKPFCPSSNNLSDSSTTNHSTLKEMRRKCERAIFFQAYW